MVALGLSAVKGFFLLCVLGGCFYVDSINQRPSLEIVNTTGDVIERGQVAVSLIAQVDDPEGQIVDLHWQLFVCDDASDEATCDVEPVSEASTASFVFDAPVARTNGSAAQSLLVRLDGVDDLGAKARPTQQLIIPLANARPGVEVTHASSYGLTLGTPIDVFAVYGDKDDPPEDVTVSFTLFKPGASTVEPIDLCDPTTCPTPADPTKLQIGKRFTPDLPGQWQMQVIASDPIGGPDGSTTVVDTIVVVVDELPCIGVVSPAPAPPSSALPVGEPTLFQVHQILDSIDPFPGNVGDPILGQSSFHWSMRINGGSLRALPTETGNSLAFDPDGFLPGDTVQLRVEIADRNSPFPLTCDPTELTCQLDPTIVPACLQRQTWTVVVQ